MTRRIFSACLITAALACGAGAARGQEERASQEGLRRAVLATVRIITGEASAGEFVGQATGSGVIIDPKGLVVTNHHVVFRPDGAPYQQAWAGLVDPHNQRQAPNRAVRLKVVADDAKSDLTVLQIVGDASRGPYPFLRFGSSDVLSYGSTVSLVGFPVSGGTTTTVTRAGVVGMDERDGWIKVDGGMMHGVSGGAAVDERGDLVGIPTMVQADQQVPFFGDDEMPQGSLTLGSVGFVRSVEALRRLLYGNSVVQPPAPAPAGLSVTGNVVEKGTGRPVAGATIGVLVQNAAGPETYISRRELLAYARSDSGGAFALNRLLRPGTYLIKVVRPGYKTLITELTVDARNTEFDVEVVRE